MNRSMRLILELSACALVLAVGLAVLAFFTWKSIRLFADDASVMWAPNVEAWVRVLYTLGALVSCSLALLLVLGGVRGTWLVIRVGPANERRKQRR